MSLLSESFGIKTSLKNLKETLIGKGVLGFQSADLYGLKHPFLHSTKCYVKLDVLKRNKLFSN